MTPETAAATHEDHVHYHQFDDMAQQTASSHLGMWVFLVTEVMFFGGLFAAYVVYRWFNGDAFMEASHEMSILLGGINTAVLLTSSLTMALSVHAAEEGRRRPLILLLLTTMVLGFVFLGIKSVEYHAKFVEHLVPGPNFQFERAPAHFKAAEIFFFLYFCMTGLHAFHMIIGEGILAVMLYLAWKGHFMGPRSNPVHIMGLYWHFVDIVWIFLFPLLYLVGHS